MGMTRGCVAELHCRNIKFRGGRCGGAVDMRSSYGRHARRPPKPGITHSRYVFGMANRAACGLSYLISTRVLSAAVAGRRSASHCASYRSAAFELRGHTQSATKLSTPISRHVCFAPSRHNHVTRTFQSGISHNWIAAESLNFPASSPTTSQPICM